MSGPVGPTRGPRFTGGYQFPRTHSARLERAPAPLRIERLGDGAYAQIVAMSGSSVSKVFEISGAWRARNGAGEVVHVQSSSYAYDQLEATARFVQLVKTILREKAAGADAPV